MMDWLITMLTTTDVALAATANAADMGAPASVMGVIMVNVFTALPPTIAAVTAMIIAIRSSKKQDTAADKQEVAVAVAAEASRRAEVAIQKADHVLDGATQRLSTAAEDAERTSVAVERVLKDIEMTRNDLCESLMVNRALLQELLQEVRKNRPVEAKIVSAGEKK